MSKSRSTPDSTPTGGFATTQLVEQTEFSKEERDIAFAVEALGSGNITERQMASALGNWTLHGSLSLADHLVNERLLNSEQCVELEKRSTQHMNFVLGESNGQDPKQTKNEDKAKSALERLDQSGRIAKLLGISVAMSGIQSEESRQHTSRYQVIRKLGQGGLGIVWLARDTKMQRYVALKEIRNAAAAGKSAVERFRREAEITGRLEHPGIVPVYQLGEDPESGHAFYVMRFLGKQTMQDAIVEYHERREEGCDDPMLLRHLLTAFVSVCQAVGHAHSRKVIHRDLKPENVAIDSFGQVIVIDWGLAKVIDEELFGDGHCATQSVELGDSDRTLAGQVLGSPLYMAPEQAAGRLDEVNESTDIFGLGAILYAILTGEAPHEKSRETSGSTTTRQLITAIASGPTPQAAEVNEQVNPVLNAVCAKAMARKRYNRYASTTELAEDIQRWMANERVSAYEETFLQGVSRWVQRHQRLSQLIGAFLTVVIVAGITMGISARNGYIADQKSHFEEMRADEREIEVQLASASQNLRGDVRFMSTLPPIQGFIAAKSGSVESESEDVWRGRLETIYEGLLRANLNYLSVSYIALGDEVPKELVRVERTASDLSYVRRVPLSRLAEIEISPFVKTVMDLEPGDVKGSLGTQLSSGPMQGNPNRLVAATPIYDELTGEFFGIVAIEVDVLNRLEQILQGLDNRLGEIFITDITGNILVKSSLELGVVKVAGREKISTLIPELKTLFSSGSTTRFQTDDSTYGAIRVQLDPNDPSCGLGVVQKVSTQSD